MPRACWGLRARTHRESLRPLRLRRAPQPRRPTRARTTADGAGSRHPPPPLRRVGDGDDARRGARGARAAEPHGARRCARRGGRVEPLRGLPQLRPGQDGCLGRDALQRPVRALPHDDHAGRLARTGRCARPPDPVLRTEGRLRAHRARARQRHRRRAGDHCIPGGRRVGARRAQALDRRGRDRRRAGRVRTRH